MKIIDRLRRASFRSNPLNNPAVPLSWPGFIAWLFAGDPTESGEQINDVTALQHLTVYACVRVISESVASLPVKLYERMDNGRREARDADLYYVLAQEPNPYMSAFTFWETLAGSLALTGNCYAEIARNGSKQPAYLLPLHPHRTEPFFQPDGKTLAYKVHGKDGSTRALSADDVLHVPLFSFDGLKGLSPIGQARQDIGLAKAATKFGARFFGNGSRPGGLMTPDGWSPDETTISQVKDAWNASQGGVNQGKTAFLPGGWKYQQVGLSPDESQFLETRKFSRADIAALFRIPPHMVGDTSRMSNSNSEQESLQFVTKTLRPYLARFEQEIARKLMADKGRNAGRYFAEFDVRELLRGDFETTMRGYALGRQWGWYNANRILEELGENHIGPQGDVYWMPVNMQNAERAVITPEEKAPAPPASGQEPPAGNPIPNGEPNQVRIEPLAISACLRLFRDAVGRVCNRSKRDDKQVIAIFQPVIETVWELCGAAFSGPQYLNGIAERARSWQPGEIEQIAEAELKLAVGPLIEKVR